jgi:hypothetical protein
MGTVVHPRSRGPDRPRFARSSRPSEKERARGRPGARRTRGLVCQCATRTRTRAYRFGGDTPAFPAQWLYGLSRALPGERAFLPPSLRECCSQSLTPASRRQDHTILPYATGHARQSRPSRPPHPTARFVTIASRPSCRVGRRSYGLIWGENKRGIFLRRGLDQLLA